jgi:phosphatidylserine/phosphatidylglycerophosphate/cardiolipin synthase-like enzyme
MKARASEDGFTLRAIAGTYNVILGMDLDETRRVGCLGFSIKRTDLGPVGSPHSEGQQPSRWLPNLIRFPKDTSDPNAIPNTSDRSPLQIFRWGDWTAKPGQRYRYQAIAQYGQWNQLQAGQSVEVEITTEDPQNSGTAVHFNRGAAASNAYVLKFADKNPDQLPTPELQQQAYTWLSRGLEEALLAFLAQAKDNSYGLHVAIYEFQKPNLLQGLKQALDCGVDVQVVYHYRNTGPQDDTWKKNAEAANAAGLDAVCTQRKANPQNGISHNKFVVLLHNHVPQAVWTGSTNWTDGAIYGQLNVGHAVYDIDVAAKFDAYWQLLHADSRAVDLKKALGTLTPLMEEIPPGPCIYPIFSPQSDTRMLDLYGSICKNAQSLLVCAPFELAEQIRCTFENVPQGILHFILADKTDSLGPAQEEQVIAGDTGNMVSVATTLSSPLHDFQNRLLEDKESYHHAGVHIHAKIIVADPLGPDPIVVMGSANMSNGSTVTNDSNSLIIRGDTAIADIYTTEFMRMFEHYLFRGIVAARQKTDPKYTEPPLSETDSWSEPYYVPNSNMEMSRKLFAGTNS